MIHNKFYKAPRRAAPLLLLVTMVTFLQGCGEQRFQAPLASDFSLPVLDGEGQVALSDYPGKVVYISFWASWCIPCRDEMPHLQALWQEHREEGFEVIGINVDEDIAAARQFAQQHDIGFPLVYDGDRAVSRLYRVAGYPTHYLVGRDGRVHFSALGFTPNDALAVTVEVQTLLRGSADGAD